MGIKVIHLISGGDTGGAKTHVHSLLQQLSARINVTMVCFTEGSFAQEARDLGIRTVVIEGHNVLRTMKKLKAMVLEEQFSLIHCHGSRGNMMGFFLSRATGLPVVSTVHSDYRLDYLGRPLSRLTYGTINTIALRFLDYRIGVSHAMTDLLISRGFHPGELYTIYNGLDFNSRTPSMSRPEFFQSVGLQADETCVVAGIAARLNPVKDIATLIRGFAAAQSECPRLRLLIAGEGAELDRLKSLAAQLEVSDQVCFAGWITDTDTFYASIDINTLTSLSETFPYALTEGARAALPTISSKVGGVPYLIDHGITGLLFEAGDVQTLARHLVALGNDAGLRQRLGQRLYEKAKSEFSLESTVQRQLDIYRSILGRQERPGHGRDGVLVCGAYGRGNAGDDAILEAILAELRALDVNLPVWVLSRSPRETRLRYRVNAIYTFDFLRFLRRMRRTRLYINGGGSLMQDVTSRRSLWFYLFTISAAKLLGNKVLMYGCGIGPILYRSNRSLASRVLQRSVDAITLRDPHSGTELKNMGITRPEIILAADPTVILPSAPREAVDGLMETQGLSPDGNYIAFILRPWPGFDAVVPVFAAAAEYAYQKYGLLPVFLPIEPRLDLGAAHQVASCLQVPFHILQDTGTSAQTIGLLSRMRIVTSMRLHGLVFSAGQGVPLIGIVYDQKVSSFLTYIGQDLFTDLNALTAERLNAHIDAAHARIGDNAFLAEGVERLREIEGHNSETAAKLLNQS